MLAKGLSILRARELLVLVMRILVLHQLSSPHGGHSALAPTVGSPGALPIGTA